MDALLSAALQEVAVEGIQGELQKNFKTASLICSRTGNWKLVCSLEGAMPWNSVGSFVWKVRICIPPSKVFWGTEIICDDDMEFFFG
jgi:hypothetical protein